MSSGALGFACAAAVVHAVWNLLIARERDTHAVTAVALVAGCVALAPAAVLAWRVDGAAVPYVVASSLLELAYFALLAAAYAREDLSVVYPLARGSAPVLVLVLAAIALGSFPPVVAVLGIALVAGGVLAVRGGAWRGAAFALAVGACLAGYTVVDKQGVAHANPLAYLELVLVVPALVYAVAMRARLREALRSPAPVAGLGMVGAYALTLAALQRASAPTVSAVRESSVVIGVALAAVFLGEPVGRRRLAGALAVLGGVVLIALA